MPKSGEGKDCDYSDGQKLQCSDGDSGDCRPKDCVGNWSECSDDIRTYTITSEGNSLGTQCPAANGAIDRTTCKTDTSPESEVESGIKSEVESGIKSEVESGIKSEVESGIKSEVEYGIKSEVEYGIKSEVESGIKSEVESGIKSEVESGIKSEVEEISKDDIYFEKKYLFSEIEKVREKMKNIISSITLDDLKNSMCRLHELKRNNKIFPDIRDVEGYKGYTDQIYESLIYNIKNSSGYDVDYSNLDENYNIQNDIFYQTWWNIKKRIDFEHLLFFVEKEYNIILELGDYIDFIKEIKLEETNYTDEEQMRIQHLQLINNYWKDQFYNWLEVKAKEIYGSEPEYVEYIKKLQYDLSDGTLFKNKLALHIYQVDVDLLEINLHKNNTDNIHILSEIYHHMYVILFYISKIFSNEWYHFNKNIKDINKRKSDDKRKINTFVSNLDDSCSKISSDILLSKIL
jgi:hypothetical protein